MNEQFNYGILVTFNTGESQIDGLFTNKVKAIYAMYDLMKSYESDCSSVCDISKYAKREQYEQNDFIWFYNGSYHDKYPRFPVLMKIIPVLEN
jgi:hypothetical protein